MRNVVNSNNKGKSDEKNFSYVRCFGSGSDGCDSRDANAQSQVSADVGNADSSNMLIVEEGYEVVTPAASGNAVPANAAPAGGNMNGNAAVSTPDNMSGGSQATPAQGNGTVVNETVTEAVSPDGVVYEVDQTVN